MNLGRITAGIIAVGVAATVVVAVVQFFDARSGAKELAAAAAQRAALATRVAALEEKIRLAEKRAAEAEQDRTELAKALEAVRSSQQSAKVAAPPATAQEPRSPIVGMVGPVGPNPTPDENMQLAQMRAYQQALAKQKAGDAMRRAALEEALRGLDPVERFNRRIEAAEKDAATAQFQTGLQLLKQAMAEKPADLAISDRVVELQATLRAQEKSVDVTLVSDGATFVAVSGQRVPARFERAIVGLPPGDYEVVGRRTGFGDVRMVVQVRNGVPPPVITVVCTQPAP